MEAALQAVNDSISMMKQKKLAMFEMMPFNKCALKNKDVRKTFLERFHRPITVGSLKNRSIERTEFLNSRQLKGSSGNQKWFFYDITPKNCFFACLFL